MEDIAQKVCTVLPSSITNSITTCANSEQYVINFLQNLLPASDCKSVGDELRKTFIFSKHRAKSKQKLKHKKKLLSAKKRMELGLRKVGCKDGMKYSDVLPLNQLWLNYMQAMLGNKPFTEIPQNPIDPCWEIINQQLMKADFHGAKILVVKSKCPSLVGLGGIVIQDTKNAFRICCSDNIIRTIPKDVVLLDIFLGEVKLQVFAKELSTRPAERIVKKYKSTRIFEL